MVLSMHSYITKSDAKICFGSICWCTEDDKFAILPNSKYKICENNGPVISLFDVYFTQNIN